MSMTYQDYLRQPGMLTVIDTVEQNLLWNKGALAVYDFGATISGTATDAGNTPTTTLRGGLLLGKKTADGKLYAYAPGNTDGTQYVYGVCPMDVNLLDINAVGQDRIITILVGGWVKNAFMLTATGPIDALARSQMRGRFFFDDDFYGPAPGLFYPWKQLVSKTANYQLLSSDNGNLFDNLGAAGAVTFTLPPIAVGYSFGFMVAADQSVTISSTEGGNIVAPGNAAASNVAYTTPTRRIGGFVRIFSVPGPTWRVAVDSPQPVTIS